MKDDGEHRQEEEIGHRSDRRVPYADSHHGSQIGDVLHVAPVQMDILNEAVRPALQLLRKEVQIVRLDRVAHGFGHEAHAVSLRVECPGEVHVFSHGAVGPAARATQRVRPIGGEAARRDQRTLEKILDRLEEGESKQVFDIASPFPHRTNVAGQHETASGHHVPAVEGGDQLLDPIRRDDGIGVDRHAQFGFDERQGEGLGAGLATRVGRRCHDRDAQTAGEVPGAVAGKNIDHDDFGDPEGLGLQAADRVGYAGDFVKGRNNCRDVVLQVGHGIVPRSHSVTISMLLKIVRVLD